MRQPGLIHSELVTTTHRGSGSVSGRDRTREAFDKTTVAGESITDDTNNVFGPLNAV